MAAVDFHAVAALYFTFVMAAKEEKTYPDCLV